MVVKYIKTKEGVEMPIRFSQNAIIKLADKEGIALKDVGKMMADFNNWPAGRFYRLVHLALQDGARKENVGYSLDEDDVIDLVTEDTDLLQQIMRVATESAPEKKTTGKVSGKR